MKKKILYINSLRDDDPQEMDILTGVVDAQTQLEYRSLRTGPEHLQYKTYRAAVLIQLVYMLKQAENEGFDAVIVGCFLDPGLEEGREITENTLVVGPGEASTHLAATLGNSFSLLVTHRRFREVAKQAIENDGAEVIILGCTGAHGFFKQLQQDLGVPVIDPGIVAVKYAEFPAEIKNRFGWKYSKVGAYETPPREEILGWQLGKVDTW